MTFTSNRINARIGLLLAISVAGCGHPNHTAGVPDQETTLTRGLSGGPSSLDPGNAADTYSSNILLDLYEGLTAEAANGDVTPAVAQSWTVDATGTQYTFALRKDARWSNGEPVRAQDFVTAWRRVVDPRQASPVSDDLRLILHARDIISGRLSPTELGISAPSDRVVVVKLERRAPFLPWLLAHPSTFPIYSETSARTHDAGSWVSNGPYVLVGWQPNTAIEVRKNPEYWDRSHVQIPRVVYEIAPDESVQYARYRAGQLDITDSVPANAMPTLRATHTTELQLAPFLGTVYYALNLQSASFSRNLAIRRSLSMAIDRKRLVDSLGFGQIAAYGLVPPGTADYTPQSWSWQDLNDNDRIAEARHLYAEAGYSAKVPLHVRLLLNSNEAIRKTAILTAAMWRETLGVSVELIEEEYRVFLESRHDKAAWDVARLAWSADYNDASNFLDTLRSHSPNNDSGYASELFNSLSDEAAEVADTEPRRSKLERSERIMLDDYPIIPIYHLVSKRLVKPYVLGVKISPLNHVPSKSLSIQKHQEER